MEEHLFYDEVSDFLRIPATRRDFLKKVTAGSTAAAFGSLIATRHSTAATVDAGSSIVSFVTGGDRRDNVCRALEPLKREIAKGIKGKRVIIKPNMVGKETILCATHPDAIRGVLDFLAPIHRDTVYIAESTGRRYPDMPGTIKHYHLYDYFPLQDEYNARLVDLNTDSYTMQWVLSADGHPLDIRIIDTFLDPANYIISLCRPKTHNCMVVTLTAKNILFGAPLVDDNRHDKGRMHSAGYKKLNFNMFLLAQKIRPRLAVLDGLEGMEGNGPTDGTPVEHGVALASTDFVAADRIGCLLMDVPFSDVGYLTYCANAGLGQGDLSKITIIGPDPRSHVITYKLHERFEQMLEWKT